MDAYIATLLDSALSVSPWRVMTAWLPIYVATHLVLRAARTALGAQRLIIIPRDSRLARSAEPRYIVGQVVFAAVIFAIALALGGAFFAFFAGGYVVASAIALGLNYHGLMFARVLSKPETGHGQVTLSTSFSFATSGQQMLGGALACVLLGLVLAQLALLGGGLFLGSTGLGYLRRASDGVRP